MPNPPSVQVVTVASATPLKVQERTGGQWITAHVTAGSLYAPVQGDSVVAVWDGYEYQIIGKRSGATGITASLLETVFTAAGQVVMGNGSGTGTLAKPTTIGATSGAPSTGTWIVGQQYLDSNDVLWVCTASGTPGTWVTARALPVKLAAWTPSLGPLVNTSSAPVTAGTFYLPRAAKVRYLINMALQIPAGKLQAVTFTQKIDTATMDLQGSKVIEWSAGASLAGGVDFTVVGLKQLTAGTHTAGGTIATGGGGTGVTVSYTYFEVLVVDN